MILSNTGILEAMGDGRLVLDPRPTPEPQIGGSPSPYDTCSVDLRLAPHLQIPQSNLAITIDLRVGDVSRTLAQLSESIQIGSEGWELAPGKFVLGQTLEVVSLPLPAQFTEAARGKRCLAARVEGKSSRARFGLLIHFTAPTIHAGWSGPITLEMMNLGPASIRLYHDMYICQLIVEEVEGTPVESASVFHGQRTPAGEGGPVS